jgi:hypothetical protein
MWTEDGFNNVALEEKGSDTNGNAKILLYDGASISLGPSSNGIIDDKGGGILLAGVSGNNVSASILGGLLMNAATAFVDVRVDPSTYSQNSLSISQNLTWLSGTYKTSVEYVTDVCDKIAVGGTATFGSSQNAGTVIVTIFNINQHDATVFDILSTNGLTRTFAGVQSGGRLVLGTTNGGKDITVTWLA